MFGFGHPAARRALAVLAATVALAGCGGCSYLKWRHQKAVEKKELEKSPYSLLLEKEYAPQDCYALIGRISVPEGASAPLLAAAFGRTAAGAQLVASREVMPKLGYYGVLLPSGTYDILLFADLNGDGFYDANEAVGRTPPDSPVLVDSKQSADGVTIAAPSIAIDLRSPTTSPAAIREKVVPRPFVVESVDDPIFAPEFGEMGVYQPNRFLARTQGLFFSIGTPDLRKAQIVLVHGIDGTPRDFRDLVPTLDRTRYQIWLFYYPSGLALDQLGLLLARGIDRVTREAGAPPDLRLAIVAHSMGGLVGRRAVNELCAKGRPGYLRLYASFDTPYGGVEAAAGAVKRGTELVPSWVDVAAGSPFLTRLHETPLPKDLPFHLFFGWGRSDDHGPSPAGDGTISLPSQLDPRAQAVATGMSGYGDTHVGILSDPDALRELNRVLDAATSVKS